MPIQTIKDPQTGNERQVYVAPKGMGNEPKPAAKPQQGGNPIMDAIGNAISSTPLGILGTLQGASVQGIQAGFQQLQRGGNLGQVLGAGQQAYARALEGPGTGKLITRTVANAGRNFLQETSDLLTADIPAAFGDKAVKPTSKEMPDAPFLGFLPVLPKAKSSGPAEDLATGIAQVAIEWVPATKAVSLGAKALKVLPGAARIGQAADAAGDAYKAAKAAQITKLAPALQKPATVATGAAEAVAANVLGKGAATGALIDFAGFDQNEGRLYDLADKLKKQVTGTPLEVPFLDYLKSNPGDVGVQGRLKNAVEGVFVGSTVEFLMRAFRAGKYVERLRTAPPEEKPAAMQAAASAAEDLQLEMVRQANTIPDAGPALSVTQPQAAPLPDMQPPAYRAVAEVDPQTIAVDPQRFQFKEAGRLTKTGASGSLAESSGYNPELAGVISVWKDPADGVDYVVNGHNRLRLAKEDGAGKVLVRYLQADSAEEARSIGALQNIAEGQGTPVDAAKFMRDTGKAPEDMAAQGINMSGPVIAKAVPLTNLPQNLFDKVTTGQLDLAKAIALGSEALDGQVINDVAAEAIKRKWSAEKITQAMQEAKFAQTQTQGGGLLDALGDEWAAKTSNFNQLLDVRTEAFRALREEMVALTSAAREGRKGILEAAGNTIDVAGSKAAKDQAAQAVEVFNRVTGYVGPVRDLLNEMAGQIKGKRTAKALVEEYLPQLRQAIEDEVNGPRLPMEQPAAPVPAAGGQEFFHGTAKEISRLDEGYYENANIYGQGFYTTDNAKVADSYTGKNAKSVAKEGGTPSKIVYRVKETQPVRFYDLDAPVDAKVKAYLQEASDWSEATARALDEVDADPGISLAKVMDEIRANSRSAGESRDTIQEVFDGIRETLEADGYGGFTHVGGKLTKSGTEHQVRIYWDPANQITLERVEEGGNAVPALEPSVPSAGRSAAADDTKALLDRALANLPPEKRAAVRAELERRAAPAAPAQPAMEIPAAAARKLRPEREMSAAESLYNWVNSGIPGDRQAVRTIDQALDLVRAKQQVLDPDAIPALDMDAARNDKAMGRSTPATQAVAAAYRQFYEVDGKAVSAQVSMPKGYEDAWAEAWLNSKLPRDLDINALEMTRRLNELDSVITEEINRIAPPIRTGTSGNFLHPEWMSQQQADGLAFAAKQWGNDKVDPRRVMGLYDAENDILNVYGGITRRGEDVQRTAYHESFHRLQEWYLNPEEFNVLQTIFSGPKAKLGSGIDKSISLNELQAEAFSEYALARYEGRDPVVALMDAWGPASKNKIADRLIKKASSIFDKLLDVVERTYNFFQGNGWRSIKSIFEDAYQGRIGDRGDVFQNLPQKGLDAQLERLDANKEMFLQLADEVPVNPPTADEAWARRFVDQIMANRQAIEAGEMTVDDLLANNVQKLESPSGARKYQPVQPAAMVESYRAHSDLVSRPDATGIPVMTDEQIISDTAAWLEKANYSSKAVLENLKQLSGPLSAYRENLVAMRAAALYVDHTNLQAGVAANRWLNGQVNEAADMAQLTAELVTAAAQQDRANRAFESVTRPLGQLLRSTQVPRPEPGSLPFNDALPPVKDIGSDFEKELVKDQDELVAETIGSKISPEAREAIITGDYTSPKVIEEFNALALNMAQSAVTPGFSQGFWRKFNEGVGIGAQGLMMYRSSQLLSSGITFWGNVINSALRTVEMPFTQAMGALVTGHPVRASRSLMIYGQYVSNLANAFRMGVESFKVGRGLFDLDRSQVDFLDRLAAKDAQGELLDMAAQKGEWSMNTMPWVSVQDKSNWAMAQKRLWQTLNLSSRLQVSADSAFKTLVGQSFEYVRNLQPGLDHAVRLGMDGNSKEAWRFAQDYAQAAVDNRLKDLTVDGKTILDAVMDSPYAQTATRWATFTDDIWAQMEPRTMQRGMELAEAKGLEGDAASNFAQEYVAKGQKVAGVAMDDIPFFARTFSLMPRIWQMGLDSPLGPLFALIQPFNRTPGDIVKSVARKSPLAPLVDTWWRDVFSEDAMTRDRAWGDIATGAAAISLASIAMTHGRVQFTGGGPTNPDARRKWMDQEGKQPYSVRFLTGTDENGNPVYTDWISMRALDPYSSLFGGLADYHELANKVSAEARERLGSALVLDLVTAVATGQLQKSYYQGFTELYEMAMAMGETDIGPNRRHPTARYIERLVASFLPGSSALRAGRRIEDRTSREVPASNNPNLAMRLFEETLGEIKNAVPGWSGSLPPKRNWITGDPVILSGVWGDQFLPPESPWLSTLMQFNPAAPFQLKGEPGDMVLREMGQLSGRGAGFVGPRTTDFTDGGKIKDNRLSPAEYEQYILAISRTPDQFGRTLLQALEEEINSDLYQQNPQGQPSEQVVSLRAAALNTVIAKYLQLGRETFLSGPYGKRLMDNKDWAEGANRDVQFRLKYGQEIDPKSFVEALR